MIDNIIERLEDPETYVDAIDDAIQVIHNLQAENRIYGNCLLRAARLYAEEQPDGAMVFPDGVQALVQLMNERNQLRTAVDYAIIQFEALDRNRVVGAQVISRLAIKKLKAWRKNETQ